LHLLLDKHGRSQFHALAAFFDPGTQKQRAEMLFHGPRADAQVARDLFIAAALHQKTQNLVVSGGYLDFIKVDHKFGIGFRLLLLVQSWGRDPTMAKQAVRQIFAVGESF
jgi:hypothetical protein